ncbi:MAG: hypothetical protein IJ187_04055 [Neisseriaceae bacterium]|nr:hypothetical protein [Neisseriaceae bacterium]MBR6876962.1 hypothetical protein [Neisseriaceae bacterium]
MKQYFFLALLLTACSSLNNNVAFSGKSFANSNLLINDVMRNIIPMEKGKYKCSDIKSVHREIISFQQDKGVVTQSIELWTLNACGKNHKYQVAMQSSVSGGTDLMVSEMN